MLLNVCIIPTDSVAQQCVEISQSFKEEDVRFKLGSGLFPHSTVYMAQFDESRLGEVNAAFVAMIPKLQPVALSHSGYYLTEGGYIEVSYQRTPELQQFHSSVIEALKDFRAEPGNPKVESYFGPYNQQQRKNAKETGYDLAYDLYRPHITLTRYKEGIVPVEFPAFPQASLSFTLPKIALYKADENGAIYEEIITLEMN
jgi:2'-5' RNA ligase